VEGNSEKIGEIKKRGNSEKIGEHKKKGVGILKK
jgi:hypothetical protein